MRQCYQTVAGKPEARFLGTGRRQIVKRQRHFLAVEIDLDHAIDRLPDDGELIERRLEQAVLHHAVDGWDQNDQPGVQGLRCIELPRAMKPKPLATLNHFTVH
jgi:hypothetical protein